MAPEPRLAPLAAPSPLLPAALAVYYGQPSSVNGAAAITPLPARIAAAAASFGQYRAVVFGDGLQFPQASTPPGVPPAPGEQPVHGCTQNRHYDHDNTVAIIARLKAAPYATEVYGYVSIGGENTARLCDTGGGNGPAPQPLTLTEIATRIAAWQAMGVAGIFLDEAEYGYGTDRARQNAVVALVHSSGLRVFINGWVADHIFSSQVVGTVSYTSGARSGTQSTLAMNPSGLPPLLNGGDIYLLESFQIINGNYQTAAEWIARSDKAAAYRDQYGTKIATVTTQVDSLPPAVACTVTFDPAKFHYAWWSTLLYGFDYMGWGEPTAYSALSPCADQLPWHPRPAPVGLGGAFTGSISHVIDLHSRATNTGRVEVDSAAHTGRFLPPPGFGVTTTADAPDGDPGDGVCATSTGQCTLRAAIQEAEQLSGSPQTITFTVSGTITLLAGLPAIADPAGLVIDGAGQGIIIDGNYLVQPFHVQPGGVADVRNLTVRRGMAPSGGGFYNGGNLTLTNATVVANIAVGGSLQGWGGGILNLGTLTITNSTLLANIATSTQQQGHGGGIANLGSLALVNSTLHENVAVAGAIGSSSGGGIRNAAGGTLSLIHGTVTQNFALGGEGGGIANQGTVWLSNSILAGNSAVSGPDCSSQPLIGVGTNLRQNPAACVVNGGTLLSGDPLLGPLADNGGVTRTRALLAGSPAIDTANAAVCAATPANSLDQRDVARPQGPACDLGAYERQPIGGRNLRIATGAIDLAWDGGTQQTGYLLLKYDTSTAEEEIIPVPGAATSYSDATAANGVVYCYVLVAIGPGSVFLGLSDLLCSLGGMESGTAPPSGFSVALSQTATATLVWTPPAGGADTYLLQVIPMDGSAITKLGLPSTATSTTQPLAAAGACFQLIAFSAGGFSTTNVVCGVPGVGSLVLPGDLTAITGQVFKQMAGSFAAGPGNKAVGKR